MCANSLGKFVRLSLTTLTPTDCVSSDDEAQAATLHRLRLTPDYLIGLSGDTRGFYRMAKNPLS